MANNQKRNITMSTEHEHHEHHAEHWKPQRSPRDYLPAGQSLTAGFAPQSEQPVRILFALSQLKASAYRVAVFYP